MQHPSHTHGGTDRVVPVIGPGTSSKSVTPLSSANTIVPPAVFKTKEFTAPAIQGPVRFSNLPAIAAATEDEYLWLRKGIIDVSSLAGSVVHQHHISL